MTPAPWPSGGRLARLPDGRTATLDGRPRCALAACCYTADQAGGLCDRHGLVAYWRGLAPLVALQLAEVEP